VGAGDRLVGVSEHSDFPPEARRLPRVGGLEVSAERVAELSPDLVLATREGNRRGPVTALAAAGIDVELVPGGSLDEVVAGIRAVGRRVGASEESERLARSLENRKAQVAQRVSARARPRAILLVWPDPPQAAGGGTFLDDVLVRAGAANLLSDKPGWPVVSAEWLATAPIEVLVVPDSPGNRAAFDASRSSGALSRGAAGRARLIRIPEDLLTRPGPRVFDALEELERAIAADLGSDSR
jgi:iron complex transport system substrate-binding protein